MPQSQWICLIHPQHNSFQCSSQTEIQDVDNVFQLLSHPADEFQVLDWLGVLSYIVVIQAPVVEEVNSDGKANLDILSTVKYRKELLNEQLIPRRYHVPAKTQMEEGKRTEKKREQITILTLLNVTNSFETFRFAWYDEH